MKKILFTFLLLSLYEKVYAIKDIKINNQDIIPRFSSEIRRYNYFTDDDKAFLSIKSDKNEEVNSDGELLSLKDGINKFIINSNINGEYEINIFKNYKEDKDTYGKLESLKIKNYDINFNSDIYEYDIVINNENNLEIEYETYNDSSYVDVIGNGNFNKSKNVILINVDNINTYKINVLKTSSVFKRIEVKDENITMSKTKKEIVKLTIITISCTLIFLIYYGLFIKKLF